MLQYALLPEFSGLQVESVAIEVDRLVLVASSMVPAAVCPDCGQRSPRVHSRYTRVLMDLPLFGRRVILEVHVRRFFCDRAACSRTTFSEPLAGVAGRYARKTLRLLELLARTALVLGGEAGARLVARSGMPVSPDTLLRYIKGVELEIPEPVRIAGIDEWAWHKG